MPGVGALLIGRRGGDLTLQTLRLGEGTLDARPAHALPGAGEAEGRSHGFFFRPGPGGGRFGLPVLGQGDPGAWWGAAAANLAFFDVSAEGAISLRGAVHPSPEAETHCEASCIDWYGNTRPLFVGQRSFALMGSELVELDLREGVAPLGPRVALLPER